MDPICCNQYTSTVKCTLCRKAEASMHCKVCTIHLCKECVPEHLSDKTKVHSVVSSTQSISTGLPFPMCSKHPTKQCELQCEQFDSLICTMCVASKTNKHNDVNDLAIFYENKRKVLKLDIELLEFNLSQVPRVPVRHPKSES